MDAVDKFEDANEDTEFNLMRYFKKLKLAKNGKSFKDISTRLAMGVRMGPRWDAPSGTTMQGDRCCEGIIREGAIIDQQVSCRVQTDQEIKRMMQGGRS
jgi:hypothetical protein